MNEILFVLHIFLVVGFVLAASRLGKGSLVALGAIQGVLANLFIVKQIHLFGFTITCSDVFAIGCILSLNLLQEYFGREAADKAVKISFFILIFFACMAKMHLLYEPAYVDRTQSAFQAIFSSTPRIILASISVFYLIQKMDVYLFGRLKQYFEGKKLPFRIGISLVFTQLLDTVLFSFLGLYGLVDSLFDIILMSFLTKCLIITCSAPLVALSRRFTRKTA